MLKYVNSVYLPVSCIYRSIELTKRKMVSSLCLSVTIPNGEMLITKYKQISDHFRCEDNGGSGGTTPFDFTKWSRSVGHRYKYDINMDMGWVNLGSKKAKNEYKKCYFLFCILIVSFNILIVLWT